MNQPFCASPHTGSVPVARTRQPVALAIFDFDGTLADSLTHFMSCADDIARQMAVAPLTHQDVQRLRAMPPRAALREIGLPLWKLPAATLAVYSALRGMKDRIHLFSGMPEALSLLVAAGIDIAIVSSGARDVIHHVLGPKAAQFVSIVAEVPALNKGEAIRRLLQSGGYAPQQAVYIGDEIRDAEAAASAGLAFGAACWGLPEPHPLTGCDPAYVFLKPGDLAALATVGL